MRKIFLVSGLVVIINCGVFFSVWGECVYFWDNINSEIKEATSVLMHPEDNGAIYIGMDNSIMKTQDGGENWEVLFTARPANNRVNFLLFYPGYSGRLYAATSSGLFRETPDSPMWERIFKGANYEESQCVTLGAVSGVLFVGTKGGLFISTDSGSSWQRASGSLGKTHIVSIERSPDAPEVILVASRDSVFISNDAGKSWVKIFIGYKNKNGENDLQESNAEEEEEDGFFYINDASWDESIPGNIYLATSKGIYYFSSGEGNWRLFSLQGMVSRRVDNIISAGRGSLYSIAGSRVFSYDGSKWFEISEALITGDIRCLLQDKDGNIFVAAEKGLFKGKKEKISGSESLPEKKKKDSVGSVFMDEPSISDVRQAAIKYAEVEMDKIKQWRKQAARSAFLPKLTIGLDRDFNKTTSSNIWGTYSSTTSPGRYFSGPNDITRYDNINWDISLSWNFGELIWNDAQTSIDVRSRLMVQLRGEIVDDVTKLYFERLRLKMELKEAVFKDENKRSMKELRLDELTAMLDGLTGGYFSQNCGEGK